MSSVRLAEVGKYVRVVVMVENRNKMSDLQALSRIHRRLNSPINEMGLGGGAVDNTGEGGEQRMVEVDIAEKTSQLSALDQTVDGTKKLNRNPRCHNNKQGVAVECPADSTFSNAIYLHPDGA
ncbi:hypothetical protein Tco_1264247 [Tanacetum coccineum]